MFYAILISYFTLSLSSTTEKTVNNYSFTTLGNISYALSTKKQHYRQSDKPKKNGNL